jgi:hypothetical protein
MNNLNIGDKVWLRGLTSMAEQGVGNEREVVQSIKYKYDEETGEKYAVYRVRDMTFDGRTGSSTCGMMYYIEEDEGCNHKRTLESYIRNGVSIHGDPLNGYNVFTEATGYFTIKSLDQLTADTFEEALRNKKDTEIEKGVELKAQQKIWSYDKDFFPKWRNEYESSDLGKSEIERASLIQKLNTHG